MRAVTRGMFSAEFVLRFRDVLDGLSNTLLISERRIAGPRVLKELDRAVAKNPSLCVEAAKQAGVETWPDGRQASWADGVLRSMGFQTILPPNSPSATTTDGIREGVMSASSSHLDGVHVLFADGAVKFVSNSIDAGDATKPSVAWPPEGRDGFARPGTPSNYGVWGAMGTRANAEPINLSALELPDEAISKQALEEFQSLPVETWKLADGTTIDARFIGFQSSGGTIRPQRGALMLTEDGRQLTIKLSELQSQAAYELLERWIGEYEGLRDKLIEQLSASVKLLDEHRLEEFAASFFDVEIDLQQLRQNRGLLIFQIESTIDALRIAPAPTVLRKDLDSGVIQCDTTDLFGFMRMRQSRYQGGLKLFQSPLPSFQLQYRDERWKAIAR